MSNWPPRQPEKATVLPSGREGRRGLLLEVVHVDDLAQAAVQDVDQEQAAPLLALGEHGDGVAVGREGEVAPPLAAESELLGHQVLVFVREAAGEVADQPAVLGVEEDDVHVALVDGQGSHQVARGRGYRRGRLAAGALVLDAEDLAEVRRLAGLDELRQVLLAQPLAELQVEILGLQLERPLDRPVHPRADGVAHLVDEVEEAFLAPALLDEVEHRVAEAVGEEAVDVAPGRRKESGR